MINVFFKKYKRKKKQKNQLANCSAQLQIVRRGHSIFLNGHLHFVRREKELCENQKTIFFLRTKS